MDEQKGQFSNADNLRPMENETESHVQIRGEYTVEERDTIGDIEKKHGISWNEIREANHDVMGEDQDLKPGMKLKIPNKGPEGR